MAKVKDPVRAEKPGKWIKLATLARAWISSWCDPGMLGKFNQQYFSRLRTSSPESAAWGALTAVGLKKEADHLKALVRELRSREADGDLEIDLSSNGRKEAGDAPSVPGFAPSLPLGVADRALPRGHVPAPGGASRSKVRPSTKARKVGAKAAVPAKVVKRVPHRPGVSGKPRK